MGLVTIIVIAIAATIGFFLFSASGVPSRKERRQIREIVEQTHAVFAPAALASQLGRDHRAFALTDQNRSLLRDGVDKFCAPYPLPYETTSAALHPGNELDTDKARCARDAREQLRWFTCRAILRYALDASDNSTFWAGTLVASVYQLDTLIKKCCVYYPNCLSVDRVLSETIKVAASGLAKCIGQELPASLAQAFPAFSGMYERCREACPLLFDEQ